MDLRALGGQMVVRSIEVDAAPQGVFQLGDDGDAEILPQVAVQLRPGLRRAVLGEGQGIAGGIGVVYGDAPIQKTPVHPVHGIEVSLLGKSGDRIVNWSAEDRQGGGGVGAGHHIVPVHVVAGAVHRVSVLVKVGGGQGIALFRHGVFGGEILLQRGEYRAVPPQIQQGQRVIIGLHQVEEPTFDVVCGAELKFRDVKLRAVDQDVPLPHAGEDQIQLGHRAGVGEHPHVDNFILGKGRVQGGAVIPEADGGAGEQHNFFPILQAHKPVKLVLERVKIGPAVNRPLCGVQVQSGQVFTACKCRIADGVNVVEEVQG
ncbi:MAG: hypothetical protein IJ751_09445 [Oscillospiraceae bacterium]|nr:hypothetical protein [Oscillospiraceae bacterium]